MVVNEGKWSQIALIEKMAYQTANAFRDNMNEEYMSMLASQKKQKDIKWSKQDCVDSVAYTLQAIYGELIKLAIVLSVASFLGYTGQAIMTTIGFCLLRTVAGGVHMKTFERCLIATSAIILGSSYISTLITNNIAIVAVLILAIIVSFVIVVKYAPLGSEEKPLDSVEEQKVCKSKSKKYILLFATISLSQSSI